MHTANSISQYVILFKLRTISIILLHKKEHHQKRQFSLKYFSVQESQKKIRG